MRVKTYVVLVALSASVLFMLAVSRHPVQDWGVVLFLAGIVILAEWFAVDLPVVGSASLSLAVLFASVVLGGPGTGAVVAAVGSLSLRDIAAKKPVTRMVFNTSQYIAFTVVAGYVQVALGIRPLLGSGTPVATDAAWFAGTALVALVMALVNALLTGTVISLDSRTPLVAVLRGASSTYVVNLPVLFLLGVVLAQLVYVGGALASLLLLVPFAVARQTFLVYSKQSEAYRETVKSLVTILEAKDPYTRGHSERVAWYAREISEGIGLPEIEVQRVEWSALLHDIGKVAVARTTLTKPDRLTKAEFDLVREHPVIAAQILEEIELLDEVIPYVAMHHERIDGCGYPDGLSGGELPLGARILAVADCFDAMTSDRAYRRALDYGAAVDELVEAKGKQLDARLVDALLERIDAATTHRLLEGSGRANARI